jgi:hypothetical protein
MKMRLFVAVLAVALFPLAADAQEMFPTFSEPPAGFTDFAPNILNPPQLDRDIINLGDMQKSVADEVVRAGFCEASEPACAVAVSVEVVRQYRCIAQNDQEYNCGLRMAWKKMETVRIAVRYLLSRTGRRSEGFVVDDEVSGTRFFSMTSGAHPSWEELPSGDKSENERRVRLVTALLSHR